MELVNLDIVKELAKKGERLDKRGPLDYREKKYEVSISPNASGSSSVKIGETEAVTGLMIEESPPFEDTPEEGNLSVEIYLAEFVKNLFKDRDVLGVELSRVVDRAIRSSKFIKSSDLVIVPGEKVYALFIDGLITNNDGNVFDTANRSAVLTLLSSKLNDKPLPLDMERIPISFTFAKIGDYLFLDPSAYEEMIADAIIVFGIANNKIVSIQKTKSGGIKKDEVLFAARKALEFYNEEKKNIIDIARAYGVH